VLDKADAPALLELVLSVLRHSSMSEARQAALLSIACQVKSAMRGQSE
jgi:hypothetical protein